MPKPLVALNVAILPPPDVARRAIELSAALPADESHGLRLDDEHLPHITLTQLFVREEELDQAFARIGEVLHDQRPLSLHVSGGGRSTGGAVWMAIELTPDLRNLHDRLMETLRGLERPAGGEGAFFGGDARIADVVWVTGYRLESSFGHYAPHITIGHAKTPPEVTPLDFEAHVVAACHLGRFCTCRRVLHQWTLTSPSEPSSGGPAFQEPYV